MALYYYDKCLASICENVNLTTSEVINVSVYDYAYSGQSTDFNDVSWCSDFCRLYNGTNCFCGNIETPYLANGWVFYCISGGDGTVWNCFAQRQNEFCFCMNSNGCQITNFQHAEMCGRLKFTDMYSGTLSDGCVICYEVQNYYNVNTNLTSSEWWGACLVTTDCIDGNVFECCQGCSLQGSFTLNYNWTNCYEIKKLTGDCYEICINGLSCWSVPLCSLDKWNCCFLACRTPGGARPDSYGHACSKMNCLMTDDTSVCVFSCSPGVYVYYCTSPDTTAYCCDVKYKNDIIGSYGNGQVEYGIPAYIDYAYDNTDQTTWLIDCEGTSGTDALQVEGQKYIATKIKIPIYQCSSLDAGFKFNFATCYFVAGTGFGVETWNKKNAFFVYCDA